MSTYPSDTLATSVPSYLRRFAATIVDPRERELWIAQQLAGDAYDAAIGGAYHHAYPADRADAMYCAAKREYDRTSAALIAYRQGMAR